jgi:GNAT superfamily N-acetyltransferase
MTDERISVEPLIAERWGDLEAVFGPRGAVGGCWCMWWRLTGAEFSRSAGDGNRAALRALVDEGRVPGLLAYVDGQPVGWCSVAPREEFGRLDRSRVLKPVDDEPVWSIVCFYIRPGHRGQGVGRALVDAAVEHARQGGARALEAYPVDSGAQRRPSGDVFTGVPALYEPAGFTEVARRSPTRPIMRRALG